MTRDRLIVTVARPCRERWDQMIGDARTRHCPRCDRAVHDLTAMSRAEVDALLAGARPCVRFVRRADGTVVTGDCADRPPWSASLAAALALAAAACGPHARKPPVEPWETYQGEPGEPPPKDAAATGVQPDDDLP